MDKPIACDLNAIAAEQRQAHVTLTEALFAQVEEQQALADGYAFGFPAALLLTAAQFVSLERLYCPFLTSTSMSVTTVYGCGLQGRTVRRNSWKSSSISHRTLESILLN